MADSTTTHPVRGSTRTVRWAVFEPLAALVDGGASVTTTKGSSSYRSCRSCMASSVVSAPGSAGRA